ncbi:MAG: choice-of-anchor V domain-containing protein [Bacteroidota bacterium]
MKRNLYQLIALAAASLLLLGSTFEVYNSSQYPVRNTNAPGENSCGGCHGGRVNTGPGTIGFNLPTTYIPGMMDTLTYSISDNSFPAGRFGFTLTALHSRDTMAGDFGVLNSGTTARLQSTFGANNPRFYMGQRNANNINSWQFRWQAPSRNVGVITFYTVGNAANGNFNTLGDNIYERTFRIFPARGTASATFTPTNTQVCVGNSLTFAYTGSGPARNFSWDFGNGASLATANTQGPHQVSYSISGTAQVRLIVEDSLGLFDTTLTTITVNDAPSVSAGPDQSFCEGSPGVTLDGLVTGGSPVFTYSWNCPGGNCGLSSGAVEDPLATPATIGTTCYGFQVTDGNGCASNIDTACVTVNPTPVVTAMGDTTICAGDSLQVSAQATGGTSFTWQFLPLSFTYTDGPSTATSILPDSTTRYSVSAVDNTTGCASAPLPNAPSFLVTLKPSPSADAGTDTLICLGDTISLFGSSDLSGSTYTWSTNDGGFLSDPNAQTPRVSPNDSATYQVVTNADGCSGDTATVTVSVQSPPPTPAIIDLIDRLAVSGDTSFMYEWYCLDQNGNFTLIPNTGNAIISASAIEQICGEGNIQVRVVAKDALGCGTDTSEVFIKVLLSTEELLERNFRVFPQPFQEVWNIRFEQALFAPVTIALHDVHGKLLTKRVLRPGESRQLQFDASAYPSGLYLLAVSTGGVSVTQKLVKQ